ncbi:hypothetical protein Pelo_4709 [Pelomyxa schiedti]|nr:hypothetical protein Pelo_4709 [Pelomyxa schiedti]
MWGASSTSNVCIYSSSGGYCKKGDGCTHAGTHPPLCIVGAACTNWECPRLHPNDRCKYASSCTNKTCEHRHLGNPRECPHLAVIPAKCRNAYTTGMCQFGIGCRFEHPLYCERGTCCVGFPTCDKLHLGAPKIEHLSQKASQFQQYPQHPIPPFSPLPLTFHAQPPNVQRGSDHPKDKLKHNRTDRDHHTKMVTSKYPGTVTDPHHTSATNPEYHNAYPQQQTPFMLQPQPSATTIQYISPVPMMPSASSIYTTVHSLNEAIPQQQSTTTTTPTQTPTTAQSQSPSAAESNSAAAPIITQTSTTPPPSHRTSEPESENECAVCMAAVRSVLFEPCHHIICCEECASRLGKCPKCRAPIASHTKVYF